MPALHYTLHVHCTSSRYSYEVSGTVSEVVSEEVFQVLTHNRYYVTSREQAIDYMMRYTLWLRYYRLGVHSTQYPISYGMQWSTPCICRVLGRCTTSLMHAQQCMYQQQDTTMRMVKGHTVLMVSYRPPVRCSETSQTLRQTSQTLRQTLYWTCQTYVPTLNGGGIHGVQHRCLMDCMTTMVFHYQYIHGVHLVCNWCKRWY